MKYSTTLSDLLAQHIENCHNMAFIEAGQHDVERKLIKTLTEGGAYHCLKVNWPMLRKELE